MDDKKIDSVIKVCLYTVFGALGGAILIYFGWFALFNSQPLSSSTADWGAFGDFVGGILNPLVALSALLMLITSVRIQKKELGETKAALVKSGEAQESQARLIALQSKLSLKQTNVQQINLTLEGEINFRNIIISNGLGNSFDKTGVPRSAASIIQASAKEIERLEDLQVHYVNVCDSVIKEIESLTQKL